jgi:chromosome segregation ATPase
MTQESSVSPDELETDEGAGVDWTAIEAEGSNVVDVHLALRIANEEIARLEATNERIAATNSRLTDELADRQSDVQHGEMQVENLMERLAAKDAEIERERAEFGAELTRLAEELASVGEGNSDLSRQVDEFRELVHRRNETIADLEAARDRLGGQVQRVRAELDAARAGFETWKDRLIQAAHEEANSRDWCEDFDEWMESNGLRGRTHDYNVQVRVTATITVSLESRSADTAVNAVNTDRVKEALRDITWDYQDIDWDAEEAERD